MPTYITLMKWTEKGISAIKGSPARLDAGKEGFKKAGMEIKETFLTMGRYDLVCVIEAPDDETAASVLLAADLLGNIRTQTMRAFTTSEMDKILAKVP